MLKKEFLDCLSTKLNLINETEKEDILVEYSTYIDDKMANGFSEEEAVAGFGNVNELANEILQAYKINTDHTDPITSHTSETIDKIYLKAEHSLSKLSQLSMNDILHILFDAFVLVGIIWLSKFIIADLLCGLILSLLDFLFHFYQFYDFLKIVIDLVYGVFAIYFFIRVMHKRIQRYKENNRSIGVMDDIKSTWNQQMNNQDLPPIPSDKPLYHERKSVQPIQTETLIKKLFLIIGMIISGFMIFGAIVWMICAIVITIYYQITSIGMYIMAGGFLSFSICLLVLMIKLWPKKEEKQHA